MSEHKQIAKVEETFLGYEDHGIFSVNVTFDYGTGSHQGTGHYALYDIGGIRLVQGIMDACGVGEWGKLKGRTVYVIRDSDDYQARIIGIEPLPTENGKRVIFEELYDEARKELAEAEA